MSERPVSITDRLERAASIGLTIAALVLAAMVARRELSSGSPKSSNPREVAQWDALRAVGHEVGSPASQLQVVEFLDFECPGCFLYHSRVLDSLRNELGSLPFSMRVVHFPLPIHANARSAAAAAECAAEFGQFASYSVALLANQRILRSMPWDSIARQTGITNHAGFSECVESRRGEMRVDAHLEIGRTLNVNATPTLAVNGYIFDSPPSLGKWRQWIEDAERGRRFKP